MFEKFTQKALDIVVNAQIEAGNSGADKVYSEHFLIGLVNSLKGVQGRLLGLNEINIDELKQKIDNKIELKKEPKNGEFIPFSTSAREILEKTMEISRLYNNSLVIPYYIALAIFNSKNSGAYEILKNLILMKKKLFQIFKGY